MLKQLFLLSLLLIGACSEQTPSGAEPPLGGDFELQSAQGPVKLSDFKGQWVIIYFGYTSCPDICPTSLNTLAQALKQLSPEALARIQPLFISIDPERDSPEQLAQYSAYFHPKLIGLTGEPEQLEQIVHDYGAYFRKVPLQDSQLGYVMDHSAALFLVNPQGKLQTIIHNSHAVDAVLQHLQSALHGFSEND